MSRVDEEHDDQGPPRKLLGREDRRASILRAAATAFARGGFAATSMSAVAAEAGVTRVILYRHFDSKEALYRAVLDETVDVLAHAWESLRGDGSQHVAMAAHLRAARTNPDGYRLLWRHADTEPEFAAYAQEMRDLLERVADDLSGGDVPDALRPWAMATLVATIIESTLAWLDHGDDDHDDTYLAAASASLQRNMQALRELPIPL